jgi:hypothetical protein
MFVAQFCSMIIFIAVSIICFILTSRSTMTSETSKKALSQSRGSALSESSHGSGTTTPTLVDSSRNSSLTCVERGDTLGPMQVTQQSSGLSEAALRAHNLGRDFSIELEEARRREDALAVAARELGFLLPHSCFEKQKWELSDWTEDQWSLLYGNEES